MEFTRPASPGERISVNTEAVTTHDIKWGRYTMVCVTFLNFIKRSSFNRIEIATAIKVLSKSFTTLNRIVLPNALQNPGMENIRSKLASPTNSGALIPL